MAIRILEGTEVPTITIPRTQVYTATHDGGDNRLPYRYRSFISFSFGGKWIEDFNLIATIDGDRMQRNLTGEFKDLTSSYEVLDGEFYHSTHFRSNSLDFNLSTDGMDSRELEAFVAWFSPGKIRELVLAEHPNRAIMARISDPPTLNMIPFEKKVTLEIAGQPYTTSVTNFKGDISLSLTMDEPFWYSIVNIFGKVKVNTLNQVNYINEWNNINFFENNAVAQQTLKDLLKIVYEDGTPLNSMIASPMLFGNDVYAVSGGRAISYITQTISATEYNAHEGQEGYSDDGLDQGLDSEYYKGARVSSDEGLVLGTIEGAFITKTSQTAIDLPPGEEMAINLYYAGTAPSPVILGFKIRFTSSRDDGYIDSIANTITNANKPYNTMTFESVTKQDLHFTTPNFITSYNYALKILRSNVNISYEKLRDKLRDDIRHPIIRASFIKLLDGYDTGTSFKVTSAVINEMIDKWKTAFENLSLTLTASFNSKTGESVGIYEFYNFSIEGTDIIIQETKQSRKENIGDMLSSNYLLLTDKNDLGDQFLVQAATVEHPEYSYKIYHDFPVILNNVSIKYKNLYY